MESIIITIVNNNCLVTMPHLIDMFSHKASVDRKENSTTETMAEN